MPGKAHQDSMTIATLLIAAMSAHLDDDDRPYGSAGPVGWRPAGSCPRRLRAPPTLGDGSGCPAVKLSLHTGGGTVLG